jgi:hypothetical protein
MGCVVNVTPWPLYPRELPGTYCTGSCRSGRMRKISPPPWLDPQTVQPVASRYTDYAIPAHILNQESAQTFIIRVCRWSVWTGLHTSPNLSRLIAMKTRSPPVTSDSNKLIKRRLNCSDCSVPEIRGTVTLQVWFQKGKKQTTIILDNSTTKFLV